MLRLTYGIKVLLSSLKQFNSSNFKIHFPINISRFDTVVNQIDNELAVKSKNPELIMKCNVHTVAETDVGTIDEFFAPSLVVPLRESVINISSNLSARKSGAINRTEKVFQTTPPAAGKKIKTLASTIAISFVFIAFALLTKSEPRKTDKTEKIVKGIKKKYSDWIVDSGEVPSPEGSIIPLNSIEDLMKVAEELGKPVIHTSIQEGEHLYFVFDGSTQYKYTLEGKEN